MHAIITLRVEEEDKVFNWLKELLEIRYEFRERRLRLEEETSERKHVCPTCEIFKVEIERANREKELLLNKILQPPDKVEIVQRPITVNPPRQVPFAIKRQILEAEDRVKAEKLRKFEEENKNLDNKIEQMEKTMGIVGSSGE